MPHSSYGEKTQQYNIFFKRELKISALVFLELSLTNLSNLGIPPPTLVILCTDNIFLRCEFVLCWCHTLQYTSVAHKALNLQEEPGLKLHTSAVLKYSTCNGDVRVSSICSLSSSL